MCRVGLEAEVKFFQVMSVLSGELFRHGIVDTVELSLYGEDFDRVAEICKKEATAAGQPPSGRKVDAIEIQGPVKIRVSRSMVH